MDDPIYDIELEDCPICRGAGLIQDEQGWSRHLHPHRRQQESPAQPRHCFLGERSGSHDDCLALRSLCT